jgi:pyrroloquinoline quinone (PQQ) biosynthesis protein C
MKPHGETQLRELDVATSEEFLTDLARSVYSSAALQNRFYEIWTSRVLATEQLALLARNYGEVVRRFPEALAALIMSTDNVPARVEYAKTLYSEMGCGQARAAHSVLFDAFFTALANQMGAGDEDRWAGMCASQPLLPETADLIAGEKRLYSLGSAAAVGAQLALEWQAYTMLSRLYDGACLYRGYWQDADDFHDSCEYFYAHIGAAEKDHKQESLAAAVACDVGPGARELIVAGFDEHLALFGSFWDALAERLI